MKLHPRLVSTLALLPLGTCLAGQEPAVLAPSTGDFEYTLSVGYESLHVYRGADSSLGSANLWQSIDVEYKNFLHFNLYHGSGTNSKYEELTPSAYIHKDFNGTDAAFGIIWYHFPDYHSSDSVEFYLRFTHDFKNGFTGWAHIGYNADADGFYEELGVKYSKALTDRFSLDPYAVVGFSQDYRGPGSDDGLDHLTFGINAPYKFTDHVSLVPGVGLALPMDTFNASDELWGSLTLSVKF
jgi:hypothetical protein